MKKRVTTLLHEEARVRLLDSGRGIPKNDRLDGSPSSPCLSQLVCHFMEDDGSPTDHQEKDHGPPCVSTAGDEYDIDTAKEVLESLADGGFDPYRSILLKHVVEALHLSSAGSRETEKASLRLQVAVLLQEMGHNAGICKVQWEASGSLTGGSYEYVDVVAGKNCRYLVDMDFAGQFEVARPTRQYSNLCNLLPRIYVGKMSENMRRLVRVMCEAAGKSLRANNLEYPPWRRSRYMVNKWFGPYKRIANPSTVEFANVANCRRIRSDDVSRARIGVRI